MARNFYREEFNILHPRIDWRGHTPGYVESEFPSYAFLVSSLYKLFGLHEAWGRLLTILSAMGCTIMVYLLAKRLFTQSVGFLSAIIFNLFPSSIFFGRAFMPDFLTLLVSLVGIYFMVSWFQTGSKTPWLISALSFSAAFALKISFAHLLILIAGAFWLRYSWHFFTKSSFWLFVLITILFPLAWYYHAHTLYRQTGLTFVIWEIGSDKWGNFQIWSDFEFYRTFLLTKLGLQNLTWAGLLLFPIGLFSLPRHESAKLIRWWLLSELAYFLVVAKGNLVHEYYQLPFLPLAAIVLGNLLAGLLSSNKVNAGLRIVTALFLLMPLSSGYRVWHTFKVKKWKRDWLALAGDVQRTSSPQTLVAALQNYPDPTLLYLCDRKGWALEEAKVTVRQLEKLADQDEIFLIGLKKEYNTADSKLRLAELRQVFQIIEDNAKFFILKIDQRH